ncbi:helix-turn-helix transcriptional regulator [Kibdelosporangium aridum]|uniref:Helix-turn-helix domain-containing protein n=1 Tax=Kibdelosporangium aridum TaxID=2030 RepID=A0A1Y5Y5I8_KIBAR|nr:helix-turn-helix transcriptional regulator [Kibdelosporangium aridum]SMD25376.1 Helix-turn-helix domain-containing protein [Kibdelosporangium aridum]
MTHNDVGSFLRARREALRPADVGLVPGGRRRTPGLRRAEVALLANISVDYYERLEQSRNAHPSPAMLASLATALRLSVDERDHLYRLAGYSPPLAGETGGYVDPAMMFLLDALTTVPAHVIDDLTTVLAQNRLSHALIGPWELGDERAGNVTWRWFTDPQSRALNVPEEHEAIGRGYAADLRVTAARRGKDAKVDSLIADLLAASDEFGRYWDEMTVEPLRSTRKILVHPHAGPLDVQCDFVLSGTGHRLVIFRPQPGSTTAANFEFLQVLGAQTFDS